MLVMYGDNNTMILAITEKEVKGLREGGTLTFEGQRMLIKDIVVMWGRDKEHVISLVKEAGIPFSEEWQVKYRRGDRTDKPSKLQ